MEKASFLMQTSSFLMHTSSFKCNLGASPKAGAKLVERAELVKYLWQRMEEITNRNRPNDPVFDGKRVRMLTEVTIFIQIHDFLY